MTRWNVLPAYPYCQKLIVEMYESVLSGTQFTKVLCRFGDNIIVQFAIISQDCPCPCGGDLQDDSAHGGAVGGHVKVNVGHVCCGTVRKGLRFKKRFCFCQLGR
jgi:hypothetical protein